VEKEAAKEEEEVVVDAPRSRFHVRDPCRSSRQRSSQGRSRSREIGCPKRCSRPRSGRRRRTCTCRRHRRERDAGRAGGTGCRCSERRLGTGVLRGRWLGVRRGDVRVAYLKVQASWQQSAPPPEGKGTSPLLSVQMKSAERCGMQCVMLCTGAVAGLGFDGLMRPKSCSRFGSLKF